ncbi:hypothetical protein ABTE38_19845, partial [Acinetobacter baumannii]
VVFFSFNDKKLRLHPLAKRFLVSLALLLYCLALFGLFDFGYTAATTRDPTRYRIFNPKYHHGLAANFDGDDVWGNAV